MPPTPTVGALEATSEAANGMRWRVLSHARDRGRVPLAALEGGRPTFRRPRIALGGCFCQQGMTRNPFAAYRARGCTLGEVHTQTTPTPTRPQALARSRRFRYAPAP